MRIIIVLTLAAVSAPALGQNASPSLICAVYDRADGALNAFEELRTLDREPIDLAQSYAMVSKDLIGRVRLQRSYSRASTLAATLVDRLAGMTPRSAVAIPPDDLAAIEDLLKSDNSVLVMVVDDDWAIDLARAMYHTNINARRVMRSKIEIR